MLSAEGWWRLDLPISSPAGARNQLENFQGKAAEDFKKGLARSKTLIDNGVPVYCVIRGRLNWLGNTPRPVGFSVAALPLTAIKAPSLAVA
jgi:hypothetical protein